MTRPPRRSFTDGPGRAWLVAFTPEVLAAVRAQLGLDLADVMARSADGAVAFFANNEERFVGVMELLCGVQIRARGLSPGAFAGMIVEDQQTGERAARACVLAMADAFPDSIGGRAIVRALSSK